MKKNTELEEIKGSSYRVDGVEWGVFIPKKEIETMAKTKIEEIWDKMNASEKFGCKMAMFPAWVLDYKLTREEEIELMDKK